MKVQPTSEFLLQSGRGHGWVNEFLLDEDAIEQSTRLAREHARETHREFASWHEAYAVIKEELEEFWDSVKANRPDLDELLQVAGCCQLAIKELGNTGGERAIR